MKITRTDLYKAWYFGVVIVGSGIVIAISPPYWRPLSWATLIVGLFLPGRILAFFWRDLLTGLNHLNAKRYFEAEHYSTRFLQRFRRWPWIRHLVWLGSSSYSWSPEALALTNLGAAQIGLGELDLARKNLDAAIGVDPANPLPYYNIGIIESRAGRPDAAELWFEKAVKRGFTKGVTDKLVMASQARFAALSGHRRFAAAKIVEAAADQHTSHPNEVVVRLLNDPTTPMQFVAKILQEVFGKTREEGIAIMLCTHNLGTGTCGIYDHETAAAKIAEVLRRAAELGYPLKCIGVATDDAGHR